LSNCITDILFHLFHLDCRSSNDQWTITQIMIIPIHSKEHKPLVDKTKGDKSKHILAQKGHIKDKHVKVTQSAIRINIANKNRLNHDQLVTRQTHCHTKLNSFYSSQHHAHCSNHPQEQFEHIMSPRIRCV